MLRREIHTTCPWLEAAKDDENYNLVVVAFTPWHALSIDALIMYLREHHVHVNAAIVITAHPQTGYALDESFFTNDCATYYYDSFFHDDAIRNEKPVGKKQVSRIKAIWNYYLGVFSKRSNLPTLYYVTNSYPWMMVVRRLQSELHKNVIITYSEEGVASYMGTLADPNQMKIRGLRDLKDFIRYQVFGNYVYRALHPKVSLKIFHRGFFGLRINTSVLPYYRESFAALNRQKRLKIDASLIERSVIICTTAWDRKQVYDDEDLRVLKNVCDYLRRKGMNILLKTHPRDTFFAQKVDLLKSQLLETDAFPMECICEACRPKGIISFSSTILVTAKVFWNIPTCCLADMLDMSKVGEIYKKEVQCFKRTFEKFTQFISSPEEISLVE